MTYAMASVPSPDGLVPSPKKTPYLVWFDFQKEKESFAVICHGTGVSRKPDDVNKKDHTAPDNLRRVDFYYRLPSTSRPRSPRKRQLVLAGVSLGHGPSMAIDLVRPAIYLVLLSVVRPGLDDSSPSCGRCRS